MASRAIKSAECNHCGGRFAVYLAGQVLRWHKTRDRFKTCPGAGTKDYGDVKEYVTPFRSYGKLVPGELLKVEIPAIKIRSSSTPKITRTGIFRHNHYENWLNRWERKFTVRISDIGVWNLTGGKYVRGKGKKGLGCFTPGVIIRRK